MRSKQLATLLVASALAVTGCQKRARAVALPPPPPPAVIALDQADRAFTQREYAEASRAYESYLRIVPSGDKRDVALFRLGLISALPPNGSPNWPRASALFKQLVEEFPESPLKPEASLILSLHSQVSQLHSEVSQLAADKQTREQRLRQLSTELEKLKKIDAERRKRP